MTSRRAAVVILATTVLLGGHAGAQAQVRFGTPLAVVEAPIALKPQAPVPNPQGPTETAYDQFGLTPPSRDQLFRVQSEQALKERLRKELPTVKNVAFPGEGTQLREVSGGDGQAFPEQVISPVPVQVCYRPLYFENKLTERFGYYVPCIQPLLSTGLFYGDFLILPYKLCQTPPWTFECDNR
jgi:hypothetical protein